MKAAKTSKSRHPRRNDVKLSSQSQTAWQKACLSHGRLRGMAADLPPQTKLERLLVQEQNNLTQLWEAFTTQRNDVQRYLLDPKKQASVYLLGFHLANLARAQGILGRWLSRQPLAVCQAIASMPQRLIDLGCGTAAVSQAWLESIKRYEPSSGIEKQLTLIDSRGAFLDAAKSVLQFAETDLEISSIKCKLEDLQGKRLLKPLEEPSDPLHIVMLGYVWNELQRSPKAMRQVQEILSSLSTSKSIFIFLEPANQQLSRESMLFRDQLLTHGFAVQYPCVTSSPCPMLNRQRDWCYSELSWKQPVLAKKIDQLLGTDRSQLSSSGYVFVSQKLQEFLAKVDASRERMPASVVVGRPADRTSRGRQRFSYIVCDGQKIEKEPYKAGADVILRGASFQKRNPKPS